MLKYWRVLFTEFKDIPNIIFSVDCALHEIDVCLLSIIRVYVVVLVSVLHVLDKVRSILIEDVGKRLDHDKV